ncbi:NAD(P)-binding protein [bacterium]|nr:NAD(P)-binding protein [bacterium]
MRIASLGDLQQIREAYAPEVLSRRTGGDSPWFQVLICGETGCVSSGCLQVQTALKEEIARHDGLVDRVRVVQTGCIGSCELGPVAVVYPEGVLYTELTPEDMPTIVERHLLGGEVVTEKVYADPTTGERIPVIDNIPFFKRQLKFARKWAGVIDPESLEEYVATGGYYALLKTVDEKRPEDVIAQIKASGLRGRGGGGFPSGVKWELTAKAESKDGRKFVVCNADEGDPGAFMDRSQLEGLPHSVLEGMALCGYAVGASHGYIYCRAEYPLAIDRLELAIAQAREAGLLGDDIGGSGFSFDLEVRMGAGAFVCGEETALIASIEGKRGEPMPKPPFPANEGVWGCPTVVNNVETYGNVPRILLEGAEAFSLLGTESSKGTKVFALAGAVKNVGLVEVPMGITLGDIIYDIGGGILDDKEFKAAQIGGPSGGCLPRHLLNVSVDYESLKEVGAMMGSGGLIVMNEDTCMVDLAKYFMEFIQEESCGKCPPCRIGTRRMLQILERITSGQGEEGDIEELIALGEDIRRTSVCGLGQTAPNPVLSTIANFREEYEAHIHQKQCPAGVCGDLVYAPCHNACPAGVNVPAFVNLAAEGRYREALEAHLDRNPFPMACGMVCTHTCEDKCRRASMDAPVAVREIKRFMAEMGGHNGSYPMPEVMRRPGEEIKDIGIIGGGPAGLTAAYFLRRLGHRVMVYEMHEELGGMMRYGIPEYRYPKAVLDQEIRNILDMGVGHRLGCKIGRDITLDQLEKKHDGIVVAIGGWKGVSLGIEHEDADGVQAGIEFLWLVAHGDLRRLRGKVIVIGGGNTAIDCARTALRLGASEVMVAYRRTVDQMPAEQEEITELLEEGITIKELTDIDEILVDDRNCVRGIRARMQELGAFDRSGRRRPQPRVGEDGEIVFECEHLLTAISQHIDLDFAPDLEKNRNGTLKIDRYTLQTSDPRIWGSGDVLSLANLPVAIGHGEEVAVSIEQTLNPGRIDRFPWREPVSPDVEFDPDAEPVEYARVQTEYSSVEERITNFLLVNRGVNWDEAIRKEARRCLRCDYREACN